MSLKLALFFWILCFGVSCTSFRYYHATHEFKERTFNPTKKGRVELNVYEEVTYSERPGAITSWERAYDKGLKATKHSIKQFCKGPYIIKTIAEKKENLGTRTDTSYRSDYSSQQDQYGQGEHKGYEVAMSRPTIAGGFMGKAERGRYAQSDHTLRYGGYDSHSTTQTLPVFRKYTDITFQCK